MTVPSMLLNVRPGCGWGRALLFPTCRLSLGDQSDLNRQRRGQGTARFLWIGSGIVAFLISARAVAHGAYSRRCRSRAINDGGSSTAVHHREAALGAEEMSQAGENRVVSQLPTSHGTRPAANRCSICPLMEDKPTLPGKPPTVEVDPCTKSLRDSLRREVALGMGR